MPFLPETLPLFSTALQFTNTICPVTVLPVQDEPMSSSYYVLCEGPIATAYPLLECFTVFDSVRRGTFSCDSWKTCACRYIISRKCLYRCATMLSLEQGPSLTECLDKLPVISLAYALLPKCLLQTPGPGAYTTAVPDGYSNKKKFPAYSLAARCEMPGDPTRKPGPGAHSPEKVK